MRKLITAAFALVALLAAGCKKDVQAQEQGLQDVEVTPLPAPASVEIAPGIVWATCNMGAATRYEMGDEYMWGELTPNKDLRDYRLCGKDGWPNLLDYADAGKRPNLLPKDDIVTRTYGDEWRTPTLEDWADLINACIWKIVTVNGLKCFMGVSRTNSNEIYFPHNGGEYEAGTFKYCYYWSSTNVDGISAKAFYFLRTKDGSEQRGSSSAAKCVAMQVRAVKVNK